MFWNHLFISRISASSPAFFWTTMQLMERNTSKMYETEARKVIENIIEELRAGVNQNVAAYSGIHKIIEQPEEFAKKTVKKVKRFLYTNS
jgi:hypothetical protein